jgi:sodium-dependent dicarboxylate transporter 2/3/5
MIAILRVASGPLIGCIVAGLLLGSGVPTGPSAIAGLVAWMAFWWVTESVPIEVTALLPIIVIPFSGIYEKNALGEACAPYADKNVFFFLGGFGLGLAIERTDLHRIGALYLLRIAGRNGANVVGAFMLATAMISMWVNNTATTMLMLPLAMSAIAIQSDRRFAAPLLIGIAFASSIGGMATLVGTAPNIFFTSFLAKEGKSIDFLAWLYVAGPISAVLLVGAWVWLVFFLFPVRQFQVAIPEDWQQEFRGKRNLSRDQWITLGVFLAAALTWISKEPLMRLAASSGWGWLQGLLQRIEDPWVAMAALVTLLLVPFSKPILAWKDVEGVPWGVLMLLGGGLSLAKAIEASSLDQRIASVASHFAGLHPWLVLTLVVAIVIAISELASNLATATALIPILSDAGPAMGIDQISLLAAVVLASSCGFMLPVATPPNTLVYAQRKFPAGDMIRAGFAVNLLAILIIPIAVLQLRYLLGHIAT